MWLNTQERQPHILARPLYSAIHSPPATAPAFVPDVVVAVDTELAELALLCVLLDMEPTIEL